MAPLWLHWLHDRANWVTPTYREMDPEYFVNTLFPPREEFPACPEQ